MKLIYTALALFCTTINLWGQYSDPNIPKPTSGYGADGSHTVGIIAFANPNFPAKDIEIYYPSDVAGKVPTIFYNHAFGGNISANISGMLNFVAKKGYAIVYVPYQTTGVTIPERYTNLLQGFRKAARDYPNIIDTTKVGFLGHSFGGGASFGNAYKCFTENNWGQDGRFVYALAPWYSFNITQSQLQAFPANTQLLMEIFDEDDVNDHRMAIDIFNNISIPASEKDFITLKSDTINGYIYAADHNVPNTASAFDALDYYGYYRILDALCDYSFNGSLLGKAVALSNGAAAQINMPSILKDLVQTDSPLPLYPESKYQYPCSDAQNLRASYCPAASSTEDINLNTKALLLYPNPASNSLTVSLATEVSDANLIIYNSLGQPVLVKTIHHQTTFDIDLSSLSKGLYFVRLDNTISQLLIE